MILSIVKYLVRRVRDKADWRDINRVRHGFEKVSAKYAKQNRKCTYEPFQLAHIKAEWIRKKPTKNNPISPDDNRVLLYLHGGGYATGSINTHRPQVSQMVKYSGIKALMIDYRLAPENKYPAALDDALLAYNWLLEKNHTPDKIAIGGDSAGGGLAVALMLYLRDHDMPLPKCAICLSPWLDLTMSGDSILANEKKDVMLVREALPVWAGHYIGDADPKLPYLSPLFADIHGLPPTYIQVGTAEMLMDDSIRFAKKAQAAGQPVTIDVYEGFFHVFQAFFRILGTARRANKKLAAFMVQQLG